MRPSIIIVHVLEIIGTRVGRCPLMLLVLRPAISLLLRIKVVGGIFFVRERLISTVPSAARRVQLFLFVVRVFESSL